MTGTPFSHASLSLLGFSDASAESLAIRRARPPAGFSGASFVARVLEVSGNDSGNGRLATLLSSGSARNLSEAIQQLNPSEQAALRARWGRSLDELLSLSQERDPRIFQHGMLEVGHRLEDADQHELAQLVYSALGSGLNPVASGAASISISSEVAASAQRRLNAMNGMGDWRARLAFNLERLPANATRWDMLFAMGGAGLVFRGLRLAATARWASSFESAFALNAAASSAAFVGETLAFTGLGRLAGSVAGHHYDWSAEGIFNEWAGGAAMLLGLKVMGGIFGNLSERWAAGESAFARVTRAVAPQAGMFAGIVVGNRLAELGSFHPERQGDTWWVDGLTTLLEFNVAGRLQRSAGGPGLANLEGRMEAYTRGLSVHRPGLLGDLFSPSLATPEGIRILESRILDSNPTDPLRQNQVYSVRVEGAEGGEGGRERVRDTGLRDDVDPMLPRRTKGFERVLSPQEILRRIPASVREEILDRMDLSAEEAHFANERSLGGALGRLLREKTSQLYNDSVGLDLELEAIQSGDYSQMPSLRDLSPTMVGNLHALAEIIGIIEYSRRTGNSALVSEVRRATTEDMRKDYADVKSIVGNLLGPRLIPPAGPRAEGEEVIDSTQGVLLIGGGDMASVGRLISHQIQPGGLPFYYRIWIITRTASSANEINHQGTYRSKLPNVVFNYDGETPMVAIPETEPGAVSAALDRFRAGEAPLPMDLLLKRLVRVQFLNVASGDLPPVLRRSYLEGLPNNAILAHAIGALIQYDTRTGARSKYPHQLVRELLDQHDRREVEVATLLGFIPGKFMWEGTPVNIGIAARETEKDSGIPGEAANIIGELLAGSSLNSKYASVTVSHWETSSNVGKTLKNILAVHLGHRAGTLAREIVEGRKSPAEGELAFRQARDRAWEIMLDVLRNNEIGISRDRIDYRLEVKKDFDECANMYFQRVVRYAEELRRFAEDPNRPLRERTADEVRAFFQTHVVDLRFEFANTRNIVRGSMQADYEYLVSKGLNLPYAEVFPKMTEEGVRSVTPFIEHYHHPSHPIAHRRVPDEIYALERSLTGAARRDIPPRVLARVRSALSKEPNEGYRDEIGGRRFAIDPRQLAGLLEHIHQKSVDLLEGELETLELVRGRAAEGLADPESVVEQWGVITEILEAMHETNPIMAVRSPYLDFPYQRLYKISGINPHSDRAFITVDGQGIMDRVTQLGLFIRSSPTARHLRIHVEMTKVDAVLDAAKIEEAKATARRIVSAFEQSGRANLKLFLNDTEIRPSREIRDAHDPALYYPRLQGLARRILHRGESQIVSDSEIRSLLREPRKGLAELLNNFIHTSRAWPLILGEFYGGPLHQAVRSMLTRPERSTLLGTYREGHLVDAFALYRNARNEPYVVAHHLMRDFETELAREYGPNRSAAYFDGLPLDIFMRDYDLLAQRRGLSGLEWKAIDLQSLPLKEALTGRYMPEVNPVVLRHFLNQDTPERAEFLRGLPGFYLRPATEAHRTEFRDYLLRYLNPYTQNIPPTLASDPLYRLLQDEPDALGAIVRGRYFNGNGRNSGTNGDGGSSLPPEP